MYDVKITTLKCEHKGGQYPETIQKHSKAVLRFLCMLSWSQCTDLCSKGTDGW